MYGIAFCNIVYSKNDRKSILKSRKIDPRSQFCRPAQIKLVQIVTVGHFSACYYNVGAHYSKAAYSIAIQIKDLVCCLSVRPQIPNDFVLSAGG